jgi:prepilin-type N-terminal cleavage/methylation domain-containing protein
MNIKYKNPGFTLIELSIVLVIIGLLAGGILIGRDLIREAELRSQIRQFQEYELAYRTFQTKYDCLPGDCARAQELFENEINGNGNGLIETNTGQCFDLEPATLPPGSKWNLSIELSGFFTQLGKSGMIGFQSDGSDFIGQGLPGLEINPNASFFVADSSQFICNNNSRQPVVLDDYRSGTHWAWVVACQTGLASGRTYDTEMRWWDSYKCGPFHARDLGSIDTKIDDGKPLSGKVMGFSGDSLVIFGPPWTGRFCGIDVNSDIEPDQYDIRAEENLCQAAYRFD